MSDLLNALPKEMFQDAVELRRVLEKWTKVPLNAEAVAQSALFRIAIKEHTTPQNMENGMNAIQNVMKEGMNTAELGVMLFGLVGIILSDIPDKDTRQAMAVGLGCMVIQCLNMPNVKKADT